MLRVLGREVALLDLPSLEAWTAEGGTLETGPPRTPRPASFTPAPWPSDRVVDADEVARAVRAGSAVVLDARAGERYRGETEPIDPVAGHIPGAVSAEWAGDLGDDGRMLDATALRRRYEALGVGGRRRGDRLVRVGRHGRVHALRDGARRPRVSHGCTRARGRTG